jgi:hypothetical protein
MTESWNADLFAQLEVALQSFFAQFASLDRCPYGATRFARVTAIREPTVLRKLPDVGEGIVEAFADPEHAQLPHAGHVDQKSTALEHDQLATRGRVPPLPRVADLSRVQSRVARQAVDQRRLSDSRRS